MERRRGRGEGSMKRKEGRLRGQPDGAAARSFTLSFARWGRAGSRCTWRAGAAAHTAADGRLGYAPLRALVTCTPSHAQTQRSTTPAVSTVSCAHTVGPAHTPGRLFWPRIGRACSLARCMPRVLRCRIAVPHPFPPFLRCVLLVLRCRPAALSFARCRYKERPHVSLPIINIS